MRIPYRLFVLFVMPLVLAAVSCASAAPPTPDIPAEAAPAARAEPAALPETEAAAEPAAVPPVVEQPPEPAAALDAAALENLQKAIARAKEARQRAADFESPAYFPSEWEAAETRYAAAAELPAKTAAEAEAAVMAHNAVADAYDGLCNRSIPLYAQAREDEITAARDGLLATGLAASFPEYLREVDETAVSALTQYEAQDYYAARDTAAAALEKYQTLRLAADAWLTRQEIIARDFAGDGVNLATADTAARAAISAYTEGNIGPATEGAGNALNQYRRVLDTGWAAYAANLGDAARKARQAALELKAHVAVKDTFNSGEGYYQKAAVALSTSRYKDAAVLYTESETLFVAAGRSAAEKRRIAEEIIKEAERKIEASDEAATQAEIIMQGGAI